MESALAQVRRFLENKPENCGRIFHGRGQCYPGLEWLTIDWYPPLVWVCLFKEPDPDWLQSFRQQLTGLFCELPEESVSLMIQHRYLKGNSVECCFGDPISETVVAENGLSYQVKFGLQQNTGLFLDMANGRQWVNEHAENSKVLNLFAYTCAFSVAALKGGADLVVNVDMAKGALSWGRENHRLNNYPSEKVKYLGHDVLRSWGKIKRLGPYDLVIMDPPSFQKGSFVATKDYAKLVRRLDELLSENGKVLACLNAPELDTGFIKTLMGDQGYRFLERIENPKSFPEADEERGLKVMLFEKIA